MSRPAGARPRADRGAGTSDAEQLTAHLHAGSSCGGGPTTGPRRSELDQRPRAGTGRAELRLKLAELGPSSRQPDEALAELDAVEPLDQATLERRELLALRLAVPAGDLERARQGRPSGSSACGSTPRPRSSSPRRCTSSACTSWPRPCSPGTGGGRRQRVDPGQPDAPVPGPGQARTSPVQIALSGPPPRPIDTRTDTSTVDGEDPPSARRCRCWPARASSAR